MFGRYVCNLIFISRVSHLSALHLPLIFAERQIIMLLFIPIFISGMSHYSLLLFRPSLQRGKSLS